MGSPYRASAFAASALLLFAREAAAADLILNNQTVTLGGTAVYGTVTLTNGSRIIVPAYNGTTGTGNLILKANSITVDATSQIIAKGSGYQAALCGNGAGPALFPLAGGRGGCGVFDGAGGGAHRGGGGRGTQDCTNSTCSPLVYEEDCVGTPNATGTACVSTSNCRDGNALPTVAGASYQHSPWSVEFGAAGGDKGCRDNDGFMPSTGTTIALAGGNGGGRIVLFAANAGQTGTVTINGYVNANGARGCASGNDPGGGGAGGSVLLIGDSVIVGATARVSAAGGRGGDTQPKCLSCTSNAECASGQTCTGGRCGPCNCTPCSTNAVCNAALGQTCKNLGGSLGNVCADASNQCTPVDAVDNESECKGTQNDAGACLATGGGGGGGYVNVLSRVASISPMARFDVRGALGGICPNALGEAGSPGELQTSGAYLGEVCDGYDNDFNGAIDDGLPALNCNGQLLPACVNGVPQTCPANVPACIGSVTDTRPRLLVIVDTSSSMLADFAGNPTFGDGSIGHVGVDTSSDADTVDGNNSRLYQAKSVLNQIFAGFPEVDFALARYHQDSSVNRSCDTASWFECQKAGFSYDDPRNNVSPAFPLSPGCNITQLNAGAGYPATLNANITVGWANQTECINYAGSCGSPRRGADVLVGFGRPLGQTLSWIDGRETSFNTSSSQADFCNYPGGGDCELRATGPKPVAGSLDAAADYLKPLIQCDGAVPCRKYGVILITSGGESCMGNPVASATALKTAVPGVTIPTYVIGLSTLPADTAQLNAIANAGGTNLAYAASDVNGIANAIATIVGSSSSYEKCNGLDDNCNGQIDEAFPDKGSQCDDGLKGICRGTGVRICNAATDGTTCQITNPGTAPRAEVCNGLDDDCDGLVDEDGICGVCSPKPEICNGVDDDCNGVVDDAPTDANQPCGATRGACSAGISVCVGGHLDCAGSIGPTPEVCNGIDDDCDGLVDGMTQACYDGPTDTEGVGACLGGTQSCIAVAGSGKATWSACTAQVPTAETCNGFDDDCNGKIDDVTEAGEACCPLGHCGTGICTAGAKQCVGGSVQCVGSVGPQAETCNGIDDDCNGDVDDVAGTGTACSTATCGAGVTACDPINHGILCKPTNATGIPETCNGIDDDCDGIVDNVDPANDPKIGVACDAPSAPNDKAPCQAGKTICKNGAYVCDAAVKASSEVCDGKDNDCNGKADDGASCPSGYDCQNGGCYAPCGTGLVACPGGYVCDATNHCVPGTCQCDACQKCEGARCIDFCSDMTCPAGSTCQCGACVATDKIAPLDDAAEGSGGGCGCSVPGSSNDASRQGSFAAAALAFGLMISRRRASRRSN